MANEHHTATIYAIYSRIGGLVYFGATRKSIHTRFNQHKQPNNKATSQQIIGLADAVIEAVSEVAGTKQEIARHEMEAIKGGRNAEGMPWSGFRCVNKMTPGQYPAELKAKATASLQKPLLCPECSAMCGGTKYISLRNMARHKKSPGHSKAINGAQAAAQAAA